MRPNPCLSLLVLFLCTTGALAARPDRGDLPDVDRRTHILIRAVNAEAAAPRGRIRALSTSTFQGFVHCPAELGQQVHRSFRLDSDG
jgi:hypothetical protein